MTCTIYVCLYIYIRYTVDQNVRRKSILLDLEKSQGNTLRRGTPIATIGVPVPVRVAFVVVSSRNDRSHLTKIINKKKCFCAFGPDHCSHSHSSHFLDHRHSSLEFATLHRLGRFLVAALPRSRLEASSPLPSGKNLENECYPSNPCRFADSSGQSCPHERSTKHSALSTSVTTMPAMLSW